MACERALLITVDCLRSDYFTERCMPRTFKLIRNWTFFTNAFSHGPNTPSSFPAIMTSAYPLMYGDYPRLGPMRITLAEVLSENGFITCGITQNSFHSRASGYARGFGHFYNFVGPRGVELMKFALSTPSFALEAPIKKALFGFKILLIPAPFITSLAIRVLKRRLLRRRFFLWVHYMDLHHPFGLSLLNLMKKRWGDNRRLLSISRWFIKPSSLSTIKDYYATALRQVDDAISRLLGFLDRADVLDDTFVAITADHGEEFFEHGHYCHGCKLYDELLHVPLAIHAPGFVRRGGHKIDGLVGLMDVPTTLLAALGVGRPKKFMGNVLLPEEGDSQPELRPYVISEVGHREREPFRPHRRWHKHSIRTGRWKLIYRPYTGQARLFDLKKDPGEKHDVADEHPDILKELMEMLKKHIRMELAGVMRARAKRLARRGPAGP